MTNSPPPVALNQHALYGKSMEYVRRGLNAKGSGRHDEYQLWASLSVELLAKAVLASVHPALVADPQHHESLFAACGVPISPDTKTITAKTLFSRLKHVCPKFDAHVEKVCSQQALRRNAEIHSGEAPFAGMPLDAWEADFWYAVDVLLTSIEKSLDEWLDAENSRAAQELIKAANDAKRMAVEMSVKRLRQTFHNTHKGRTDREAFQKANEFQHPFDAVPYIKLVADEYALAACPSCGSQGALAGDFLDEQVTDEQTHGYTYTEYVQKNYWAEEFFCRVCGLHLKDSRDLRFAGIDVSFSKEEERERDFEPDYGND